MSVSYCRCVCAALEMNEMNRGDDGFGRNPLQYVSPSGGLPSSRKCGMIAKCHLYLTITVVLVSQAFVRIEAASFCCCCW